MVAKHYNYNGELLTLVDLAKLTGRGVTYWNTLIYKYGADKDLKKVLDFVNEPLYYYGVYDMRQNEMCVCFGTLEQCAAFLNIRPATIHELKCRNGGSSETEHGRLCGREGYEVHMFNKYDLMDEEELR